MQDIENVDFSVFESENVLKAEYSILNRMRVTSNMLNSHLESRRWYENVEHVQLLSYKQSHWLETVASALQNLTVVDRLSSHLISAASQACCKIVPIYEPPISSRPFVRVPCAFVAQSVSKTISTSALSHLASPIACRNKIFSLPQVHAIPIAFIASYARFLSLSEHLSAR